MGPKGQPPPPPRSLTRALAAIFCTDEVRFFPLNNSFEALKTLSYYLLLVEIIFRVPNNPPPITEIYCCYYGPVVETQLLLCLLRSRITETEWCNYVLLRETKTVIMTDF